MVYSSRGVELEKDGTFFNELLQNKKINFERKKK